MTVEEFMADLTRGTPEGVVDRYLAKEELVALDRSRDGYTRFRQSVVDVFEHATEIYVVGSGNWEYSLDPDNRYRPFSDNSDIDVAVVSQAHFDDTWDNLRAYQRGAWYILSVEQKEKLTRNGQNVYAGFVSPLWIPDRRNQARFQFSKKLDQLSGPLVRYQDVHMLFFRNHFELVDYYKRGIVLARGGLYRHGL